MSESKAYIFLDELTNRYPILIQCKEQIASAFELLKSTYMNNGKLLVAGNGGSAADAEHIVGELMKSFLKKRSISNEIKKKLLEIDGERGAELSERMEGALPAISLISQTAIQTAYSNDKYAEGVMAQQVQGYGKEGDCFLGITTSGNSENILNAAIMAKAIGMKVIGLTGNSGGELLKYVDACIRVPEKETYKIQELHLPIYHCLCMMLEEYFFGEGNEK